MSPRRAAHAATRANAKAHAHANANANANANADQATNVRNGPKAVIQNGNRFASSPSHLYTENQLT